jgi:hypothetical protein
VIYGHPYETVDAEVREQQVEDFFAGTIDQTQLLHDYAVAYIVVGPREKKLGAFDAAHLPVAEVFSSGDVTVYCVKRET